MLRNGVPDVRIALLRRLEAARDQVRKAAPGALGPVRWDLREAEVEAGERGRADLAGTLRRFALLTELGEGLPPESAEEARAIAHFLDEGLGRLSRVVLDPASATDLVRLEQESDARWGGYLALLAPAGPVAVSEADDADVSVDAPAIDPEQLLRMFGHRPPPLSWEEPPARPVAEPEPPAPAIALSAPRALTGELPVVRSVSPSVVADLSPEASARDDFRSDAEDLLERIEALAKMLGGAADPSTALRELDRCLHTLKGAAGAIGLNGLVATVDGLEDWRESHPDVAPTTAFLDQLQGLLGLVEETLTAFRAAAEPAGPDEGEMSEAGGAAERETEGPPAVEEGEGSDEADDGGMVRVPRGKVNDLLDLVAESLILHGPRASWVGTLKGFADAARSCRHRLSLSIERLCDLDRALIRFVGVPEDPSGPSADDPLHAIGELADHLGEQAEDMALLSQTVRATAERMAEDLDASTRLTRRLWDLLHEVRIIPVRSLFRRLARVAQAVALSDARRIEVVLAGEEIGLDRPVQDRVFEPLMHIVRNALGHGIEPPEERTERGKTRDGRLTLEARRDGNSVVLEVRDDGRGLDYRAIEAKGRRLGLIEPGQVPGIDELHTLIFQPGFTTRDEADSISGRGIGMDVVAREVARLQGTIALTSRPGEGTAVAIRLPARLTLEQAILFRVDGQAFSLPLGIIDGAEAGAEGRRLDAREALDLPLVAAGVPTATLPVRVGGERIALVVDAIEGPQELVVRPLHPLLADHPVVSGTSLSADGELVLVLDASALAGRTRPAPTPLAAAAPSAPSASQHGPILVVDDSISIRHSVVRHLHAMGLEAVEATDGVDAVRLMQARPPRLVITDLQMPRMDGYELLNALRQQPGSAQGPPVLVSSSRSDPATRRRVLELGARGFIAKPVSFDELAEAIGPFLHLAPGTGRADAPLPVGPAKAPE
ncbi:MAG: response regulator [Isosphaeraceae bacterium]|nr:response regulator [Isosphaeraceae bacterium]